MATEHNISGEIIDSPKDQEKLQGETVTLDLPDVKDIPGQEHIKVPHIKEMNDTTISSSDEEGDGLFDDDEDELYEDELDEDVDVTEEEKKLLQESEESMGTEDELGIKSAALDDMDEDGELLNEADDESGDDLDVPGAEDDDLDEEVGDEDEENNNYSLGGDKN